MSDTSGTPTWKKIYMVVMFVILVVPLLYVIVYPALTGTSAKAALGQFVSYFDSPEIMTLLTALVILAWVMVLTKYGSRLLKRFSKAEEE